MVVIAPNTEIYLIKCPIELDNDNQLSFANATAQHNYFDGLPKVTLTNATFQRKDGIIRWPANMESVLTYNYCMYRNKSYGNKWFYAFITDIQWLSNDSCGIQIKQDTWQTWQFDLTFRKCFVEREHVNDDTFGKHTIPEGLEYGDYIVNDATDLGSTYNFANSYVIAQVSQLCSAMYDHGDGTWAKQSRVYAGLPNGCWFIAFAGDSNSAIYKNIQNFVRSYDSENLANAIVNMFVAPKAVVTVSAVQLSFNTEYGFDAYDVLPTNSYETLNTFSITRNASVDGYIPKNNKVLCSPYNYLMITNNGGNDIVYPWEDFASATASFVERGILNAGCDIKLTPNNFKRTNTSGGFEWSLSRQKLPTISWNSDFYLNWYAVNSGYVLTKTGLTGVNFGSSVIGGMLSGNVGQMAGAIPSLASDVANTMQQVKEAEMTPDASKGNSNTGDFNYSVGKNCYTAYKMSIKAEYAKLIDDYFTCYGYKVNDLKIPNINTRTNWNYIKTKGCNVIGNVPQSDIAEIKGLFNRGITIWHNPNTYLDYSQNNPVA